MNRHVLGLVALLLSAAAANGASAQSTFHVKEFDFQKRDWIFETINAYQGGLRPRSDRVQAGHELGLSYGVSNFWLPRLLLTFDKEERSTYDVQRLVMENTFTFKPVVEGKDGIGFAWFQSIEGALTDRQTNATIFGPIITAQLGRFSMTSNSFFEKSFGQNREQGIDFQLAWQARYEIMDKVKLGLEGYPWSPRSASTIGHRRPALPTASVPC